MAGSAAQARRAESDSERSRLKSELLAEGRLLGLLQSEPAQWFARGCSADDDRRIQCLVDARNAAKKERDFARDADIRAALWAQGIVLEDTAPGVRWRRGACT